MAAAEDGILEEVLRGDGSGRGMASFFPIIVGLLGPPVGMGGPDRVVLVNPFTQGMVVLEGDAAHLSDILADGGSIGRRGPLPASKASIEAMSTVEVGEGDLSEEEECAVCLDGFKSSGEVVREMPCRHRFHGGCIEKWLGMRGSCPLCRYQMPVEGEEGARKGGEREEVGEGTGRRDIWMTIAFSAGEGRDRQQEEVGRANGGDEEAQQR